MSAEGLVIELSIVICTRNRAHALGGMLEALANVRSDHAWEVLIVDNASTDDTTQFLARAEDIHGNRRTAKAEQIGLGAARDFAWRLARGAIIAFTDDDCYVAPDYIDRMIEAFGEYPEIACIGGRILLFDPTDYPVTIDEREEPSEQEPFRYVPLGTLQGANMAFRRSALSAIGGIDRDLGAGTRFPCEDIDAVAAIAWAGMRSRFDPRIVVYHHHGRKLQDLPKLMVSYDQGRGAYYAKYLLRPDSRWEYFQGWVKVAFRDLHRGSLKQFLRELASARRYIIHRRHFGFLAAAAPVAFGVVIVMSMMIAFRIPAKLVSITHL